MNPLHIIKALNVIEDCQFCPFSSAEIMVMHPFIFQVGEETLRYCIIISGFSPIHALYDIGLRE